MNYSYFDSIKSKRCKPKTVEELFERMKQPDIADTAAKILEALKRGDEKEASRLKAQLPVIVLNRLYEPRHRKKKGRGKANRSSLHRLRQLCDRRRCQSTYVRHQNKVARQ